jgi:hypothetical protein
MNDAMNENKKTQEDVDALIAQVSATHDTLDKEQRAKEGLRFANLSGFVDLCCEADDAGVPVAVVMEALAEAAFKQGVRVGQDSCGGDLSENIIQECEAYDPFDVIERVRCLMEDKELDPTAEHEDDIIADGEGFLPKGTNVTKYTENIETPAMDGKERT